ncbi:MAG: BlaR1 family beta-lactam sensor/signal transducer, partial [Acetatifactor sp.]|nr:BlaR1 family beta-lactam sensor/signal transducer [Acetatifactor sp.]
MYDLWNADQTLKAAMHNSVTWYFQALDRQTGTEEVNGENTSGWFIGYVEKDNRTYFFATNIRSERSASGPLATELTFSILSDLELWNAYHE